MTKRFRTTVAAIAALALLIGMVAGCTPTKPAGNTGPGRGQPTEGRTTAV